MLRDATAEQGQRRNNMRISLPFLVIRSNRECLYTFIATGHFHWRVALRYAHDQEKESIRLEWSSRFEI